MFGRLKSNLTADSNILCTESEEKGSEVRERYHARCRFHAWRRQFSAKIEQRALIDASQHCFSPCERAKASMIWYVCWVVPKKTKHHRECK